ncbi:hypothetical protein D9758_018705 [Tetrapyrgos nigripes]|uniref:Dyp-type peroxidase C-terminal domain-containing protein n=1 Tax=Tetrapyrgos nigripes TaxID=182062 RepID=A0A8H5B7V5_9AGAR|nr:hypothetical protein D9758_018705 [Tetrapyrgos nigripes]
MEGAPLALCPWRDDLVIGNDDQQNNDFDYRVPNHTGVISDYHCPFTAHTRKTVPRNLDPYIQQDYLNSSMIVRAGLPYGEEVSDEEKKDSKTKLERGLLFVCYQSNLNQGFIRQQLDFGDNRYFPTISPVVRYHGPDPIIGSDPPVGSGGDIKRVIFDGDQGDMPQSGEHARFRVKDPNTSNTITVSGFAEVKRVARWTHLASHRISSSPRMAANTSLFLPSLPFVCGAPVLKTILRGGLTNSFVYASCFPLITVIRTEVDVDNFE